MFFLKPVILNQTQVICGVICALYKVISQFFIAHTYCASIVHILKNGGIELVQ